MTESTEKRSYKDTLNLPRTPFAMKANLVQNEPASVKRWLDMNLYQQLRQARKGRPCYVFHDGPPYANGSIHMGHLLNKVMKDLVVRSRTMMNFDVPYTPGWDCHGLPIEHKVMQEAGDKAKTMEPFQIRRKCKESAEKFIKLQKGQMQRLLTIADYDKPYVTMDPGYEAAVLEVFAEMVAKGLVYRALKPVHWSIENRTALAEAELEYYDREDTSVYGMFEVVNKETLPKPWIEALTGGKVYLMIWTTTPWTLPANMAVAVHPRYDYGLFRFTQAGQTQYAILARELGPKVLAKAGTDVVELGTCRGEALTGLNYNHPFMDGYGRRVVTAEYVTLEDGTGLVHTAPGHGVEDYQTGLKNNLTIYCPVKEDGTFDDTVPSWLREPGVNVWKANELVVEKLRSTGNLFFDHKFTHSYPHDWRGKTPTIFRATEQWFVNVNGDRPGQKDMPHLRALALQAINTIDFKPAWGKNRLRGMLETRPDWCISRQRAWGLPIPAFYNDKGDPLLTAASVSAVAKVIAQHGSDAWFKLTPAELLAHYDVTNDPDAPAWARLGEGRSTSSHEFDETQSRSRPHPNVSAASTPTLPEGEGAINRWSMALTKGNDIFDVWFDSGCSWHAALQRMPDGNFPADLYLEGSDQHRGWFQVSLLCALAYHEKAPFKQLLTHGFTVDKDGKKMSKSLGNTIEVEALMKELGADVCRWWVCSLNTENDIKVDMDLLKLAGEEYRKVRNTIRFLLSNLFDYQMVAHSSIHEIAPTSIDAWVLGELNALITLVTKAYTDLDFPKVHASLFNFCNTTLSAVYLSATKDRLYCDAPASPRRKQTQQTMAIVTDALLRLLAPVIPHTAEEAWLSLYGKDAPSVHLALFPEPMKLDVSPNWPGVITLRDAMLKTIEEARSQQGIDNPLDIGLIWPAGTGKVLGEFDAVDLADLCGISRFELREGVDKPMVEDLRQQPRCERSWKRDGTVQLRSDGGMLSRRDALALGLSDG